MVSYQCAIVTLSLKYTAIFRHSPLKSTATLKPRF